MIFNILYKMEIAYVKMDGWMILMEFVNNVINNVKHVQLILINVIVVLMLINILII